MCDTRCHNVHSSLSRKFLSQLRGGLCLIACPAPTGRVNKSHCAKLTEACANLKDNQMATPELLPTIGVEKCPLKKKMYMILLFGGLLCARHLTCQFYFNFTLHFDINVSYLHLTLILYEHSINKHMPGNKCSLGY